MAQNNPSDQNDPQKGRKTIEELLDTSLGMARPQRIEDILAKGPNSTAELSAAQQLQAELDNAMDATEDEKNRAGELLNAFFGEYNQAVRSYAFAKNGMTASEEVAPFIEAFMENPNPDIEPEEVRTLGWEPFMKLMQDLSMPVHQMHKAKAHNADEGADHEYTDTPESIAIRDNKVIPILRQYEDNLSLYDIDVTEDERQQSIREEVEGFALVTQAMMHDEQTRGLLAAIKKKTFGNELSGNDQALLDDHPTVVETVESILSAAGHGYAAAPLNQVHYASGLGCQEWTNFMRAEHEGRTQKDGGNIFKADTHFEEAMGHHKKALAAYKAMHEGLAPVCQLVEESIDSTAVATVDLQDLERTKSLVKTLPELGNHDKIKYNVNRIASAIERVFKSSKSEKDITIKYAERSAMVNAYAETTQPDVDKLTQNIEQLQDALEASGGTISVSDQKFRDVYMGMRALNDRLEMMQTAAEQLHNDMGKITGKQNQEWLAQETEGEKDMFEMPAKPSEKLKKVAQEIQRNCLVQHEVASQCRKELTQMIDQVGKDADRFDVAHDFFSRLRDTVAEQIASMQQRQDLWDKAHPGSARAKTDA